MPKTIVDIHHGPLAGVSIASHGSFPERIAVPVELPHAFNGLLGDQEECLSGVECRYAFNDDGVDEDAHDGRGALINPRYDYLGIHRVGADVEAKGSHTVKAALESE
jgi:hypothetical protein